MPEILACPKNGKRRLLVLPSDDLFVLNKLDNIRIVAGNLMQNKAATLSYTKKNYHVDNFGLQRTFYLGKQDRGLLHSGRRGLQEMKSSEEIQERKREISCHSYRRGLQERKSSQKI